MQKVCVCVKSVCMCVCGGVGAGMQPIRIFPPRPQDTWDHKWLIKPEGLTKRGVGKKKKKAGTEGAEIQRSVCACVFDNEK